MCLLSRPGCASGSWTVVVLGCRYCAACWKREDQRQDLCLAQNCLAECARAHACCDMHPIVRLLLILVLLHLQARVK